MKWTVVVFIGISMLFAGATAEAVPPEAQVRVVHASPDAPPVDVWVNGVPAFTGVEFGQARPYAALAFGRYRVQVVPSGLLEPVVIDARLFLRPNKYYTVVAVGLLSEIAPLVLWDRNNFPPLSLARVRFVHASPDAPPVDVAVTGGPILFADVAFTEVPQYIQVRPGVYDLEVRVAGTDVVVLSVPGVPLDGGTVYTIFAIGLAFPGMGDPPLQALLTVDAFSKFKAWLPSLDGSVRLREPASPKIRSKGRR